MSDKVGRVKLRDLAKVMGNFSWAIPSVPFAQDHFRKLKISICRTPMKIKKKWFLSLNPPRPIWFGEHLISNFVMANPFFPTIVI
jgi:hypothetical protein